MTPPPLLVVLAGGMLIGAASAVLWTGLHKIAGISGIVGRLIDGTDDRDWRVVFLVAMVGTGAVLALVAPALYGPTHASLGRIIAGGLLVGFGTRLGNGCTSGHGVCGVSRFSARSILATVTFLGVGMITVGVYRAVFAVAP